MHRPGADIERMDMADILCDFCGTPWREDRPMIEGHRGSCICGSCLSLAYREVVLAAVSSRPEPLPAGMSVADVVPGAPTLDGAPMTADGRAFEPCCLCLEGKPDEPHWRSPLAEPGVPFEHKLACRRCIKMAASTLERDRGSTWHRPRTEGDRQG